ncbi:hypothetical protein GMOD_00001820 [Pyrenophora seminiperda CCB06]|uniref:Uncharacterized protein n=1 Tax=Pyrenophora seminiperda CCB06 TaxID=1302712 RepID=A0A3M7LW82_9PLEO|nr:hypothetical protein GMOD_00001820 [Pyrenophora seminiperda CCB06]
MAPATDLSREDLRLFLLQLQNNPKDVTQWDPIRRMSLARGGLIDLTIYGRRIASAPRFALMAIFPRLTGFLIMKSRAPAVNFTFDVPKAPEEGTQSKLTLAKEKMSDAQIKVHESALIKIAQWLTALCTRRPMSLTGASLPIETCIRFICANVLGAPEYVQHLTEKLVELAVQSTHKTAQVTEFVKSCRGETDAMLVGLATKVIEKKRNSQATAKHLQGFLAADGNQLLRKKVEKVENEMEVFERVEIIEEREKKNKGNINMNFGTDAGYRLVKKQKLKHKKADKAQEVIELD